MSRGSRIPDDFAPSPALMQYARDQGVSDVTRMLEDFRDFWSAKAGKEAVKLDWSATWRMWARKAGDADKEKAARQARWAKPTQAYQRNAEAAHGTIADQLFGSNSREDERYGQRSIDAEYVRH